MIRRLTISVVLLLGLSLAWACPFDSTLRAYLSTYFWMPFAKHPGSLERPNVRRISAPFGGMGEADNKTTLGRLRASYQGLSTPAFDQPAPEASSFAEIRGALAAARAVARGGHQR